VTEPVTVLDPAGLAELFNQNAGRRFVGAIDCGDCVELVFEERERKGADANLISVYTSGPRRGLVFLGFVSQVLIDDGYGSPGMDEGIERKPTPCSDSAPLPGDDGFPGWLFGVRLRELITAAEYAERAAVHKLIAGAA
jgi:hypothetical protein